MRLVTIAQLNRAQVFMAWPNERPLSMRHDSVHIGFYLDRLVPLFRLRNDV